MGIKVLILEDNPVTRGFLARVIAESFNDVEEVVEASDLASARQALRDAASPFQMVLLDLELPDGNGLELLGELSAYPATRIVTTLYADDEQLLPALQKGADGYLLKENRFEVLVEDLQRIIRGQLPLSPSLARSLMHHFRPGDGAPATGTEPSAALNAREMDVLTYVSKGFTIKEMASLMGVKWFTVFEQIKSIYRKTSGLQAE